VNLEPRREYWKFFLRWIVCLPVELDVDTVVRSRVAFPHDGQNFLSRSRHVLRSVSLSRNVKEDSLETSMTPQNP
jgi:hypothetical protein